MRKNLIRVGAAFGIAAGMAVCGSAVASAAETYDVPPFPSAVEQQQIFIEGGKNLGMGAAQLVSATYLGVPASVIDAVEEAGNYLGG
ncbi:MULTISPECIES: hypothetical protein [Thermocrispum]|jgi:hypothetical protein|uniref:Uncharacterized protein n=1 Tax=Thermocrispum agreste TaxID=37925 RepID=A0A2W4JN75_9PSEU|nr:MULTISPECIES: hypothetical protein [Thermocrispum]PZM99931.1 MAG: hypothetical protein DIU77_04685 [Thermocrispum agreste]